MGQFDNFKSIALLLTGAFLVSFGIINFLNIEIQSRSNHGIKVRNENLFEVLGRKISEMIAALREKNSHRRFLLHHFFTQENSTRSSMRKLQHFIKDSSSKESRNFSQSYHRLRHEKNAKRLKELLFRDKNNSVLSTMALHFDEPIRSSDSDLADVSSDANLRRTLPENSEMGRDNLEKGFRAHEHCYTSNDVLEIIAITCLVNFIFWFLIIICVNVFTRNQKIWRLKSFESLSSNGSGSESDLNQGETKVVGDFPPPNQPNFVKDYVISLINESGAIDNENEVHERYSLEGNSSGKKLSTEKNHQRFQHISNAFFDRVSSVNLKAVKKRSLISQEKSNKIVNSFSMDELIF